MVLHAPLDISGPVQSPLHSCAEPNLWIKYGKRAASESVWYGSFSQVRQKRLVRQTFDRVCRTFDELNLILTHSAPSESDVAPVSLQSRTYSVRFRFGTWKVRRLNQALVGSIDQFTLVGFNCSKNINNNLCHLCKKSMWDLKTNLAVSCELALILTRH